MAHPNLTIPLEGQCPPKVPRPSNRIRLLQETSFTHALSPPQPEATVRNANGNPGQVSRSICSRSIPPRPLRSLNTPSPPNRSFTIVPVRIEKGSENQKVPFKPVSGHDEGPSPTSNIPRNKKDRLRPNQAHGRQEPQEQGAESSNSSRKKAPRGRRVPKTTLLELLSSHEHASFTTPPNLENTALYLKDITVSADYSSEDVEGKCEIWSGFTLENMLKDFQFLIKPMDLPRDLGM